MSGLEMATHKHIIGVSGMGKSKLLEHMFLSLFAQRIGVSFVDPHSDSADAILATLVGQGYFEHSADAYKRLLFVEFSDSSDAFVPFNILNQPRNQPHAVAAHVLDALHRLWPSLADGVAASFDNIIKRGARVLIANQLPLPALERLITDRDFREHLLTNVTDEGVLWFWRDFFGRMSPSDQLDEVKSSLRRLSLLTDNPLLRNCLGQAANVLDFRAIIDSGTSVLFSLGGVHDHDARRLLGCLITIGYENAALSRTDLEPTHRRAHHLLLDEFSDYSAQSEEALSRTLSLTRKFGLYSTMAHQTWSQTSARLQGALQNVGVKIALRVGRSDAELLARSFGAVDAHIIKSDALIDHQSEPRGQPVFMELPGQWEEWITTLTDQAARRALIKLPGKQAVQIKTPLIRAAPALRDQIDRVHAAYRHIYQNSYHGHASDNWTNAHLGQQKDNRPIDPGNGRESSLIWPRR